MSFSRRHFFYGTLLAGAVPSGGFGSTASLKALGYKSPNEKLNFGTIGAGGQAASNISAAAPTENIVTLCDVDDRRAAATFEKFPKAPRYKDFRQMLRFFRIRPRFCPQLAGAPRAHATGGKSGRCYIA